MMATTATDTAREHATRRLGTVPLTPAAAAAVGAVREAMIHAHAAVQVHCPPGPERDRALGDIEQACMWAIKGISHA
jgi:hypothetical protein